MTTERLPMLVILAGGSSSRLWPLRDKSLIRFLGKPLLELQLETYLELGLSDVVVIGNESNLAGIQAIVAGLAARSPGARFQTLIQREPKGMGDALLQLKPLAGPHPIYLCQVHDVFDRAFHQAMLQSFREEPGASWLAAKRVDSYFPGGYLVLDEGQRITNIVEKPKPGSEPSDLVNIVAHIHPNLELLLQHIEAEYADTSQTTDDHYERAMAQLMQRMPYRAVPYGGEWNPIKYPWHVLKVMEYYLHTITETRISPTAKIEEGVNIAGPVVVEDGVRIFRGADIRGPAYIGKGSLVGQFAQVRHSMIGERCEVGLGSEVNRSYVGQGSKMHTGKVLDSIMADNDPGQSSNVAAGAITANLRVDYKNVKSTVKGDRLDTGRDKLGAVIGAGAFIGINAMVMPGVKIGENSIVGPGTIVDQDVPDNTRVYVKQETVSSSL